MHLIILSTLLRLTPCSLCRNATRLLVTHQTQWLHSCSRVVVLQAGSILADAPWTSLKDSDNKELQSILFHHGQGMQQHSSSSPAKSDTSHSSHIPAPETIQKQLQTNPVAVAADAGNVEDSTGSLEFVEAASAHSSPMAPVLAQPGQEEEASSVHGTGTAGLGDEDSDQTATHTNPLFNNIADAKVESHNDVGNQSKGEKEDKLHSPGSTAVVELAAVSKPVTAGTSDGSLYVPI